MIAFRESHLVLAVSWLLAAMFTLLVQASVRTNPPDLEQFYLAGQLILAGRSDEIYSPAAYEPLVEQLNESGAAVSGTRYFNRPAFAALPWAVVSQLPYDVVAQLAIAANILGICLLTWKLPAWFPALSNHRPWLICFPPFLWSLALGQDTIFLTLALAYSLVSLRKDREILAGMTLSLCLVKPQLIWLVPAALFACGKRRTVYSFLACGLLFMVVSLSMVGPAGLVQWRILLASASTDYVPQGMPTLRAIGLQTNAWVAIVAACLVAGSLFLAWRNRSLNRLLALTIIASVLFSPHAYVHDTAVFTVAAGLQTSTALRSLLLLPWPAVVMAFQPSAFPLTYAIAGLAAAVVLGTKESKSWRRRPAM
jgi:hypothetical protein